jgi:hypothetical protein
MLVTMICLDKPNHVDLRLKTRPRHLEWLEAAKPNIKWVGPILADDGATMIGSLYLAEFDTLAAARAFQRQDPYDQAGLFERVIVQPVRQVLPK